MNSKGLTLIELLIAISIAGLLLVIGLPSFESVFHNSQASSLHSIWKQSLHYARSEAINRGMSISICPAANSDFSSCGSDWSNGWIIFTNPDEDSTFSNNSTEFALRVQEAIPQGVIFSENPSTTLVTFNSRGFPLANTSGVIFSIQAVGCSGRYAYHITVSPTGYLQSENALCE